MQTPNTQAGRFTEEIMAKVREKLPNQDDPQTGLTTSQYNRIYEAVLEWLSGFEFPGEA